MKLGRCDVCIAVASAEASREFYEKLDFERVEGTDEEGWAVVTNGELRLGLFERRYMDDDSMSLNFRDGDIPAVVSVLKSRGLSFETEPVQGKSGGWSAALRDPDGTLIFLDAAAKL